MKLLKLNDILKSAELKNHMLKDVSEGKILVYPTDTIYGLGCDATNTKAVRKIRSIKRANHPFSVIAPSKDWMLENLEVGDITYLADLPGPVTLIFRKRNINFLSDVADGLTLGVRIPRHPLTKIIQQSGKPFVTTSVNISGSKPATSIESVPKHIKDNVDIAIDGGVLNSKPSTLIDLTGDKPRVIR